MRTIAKLAEARNQVHQIALDDARVGHRGSPRLLLEPALRRGVRARDDFDRHVTAEEGVARAVDLAHAAGTQRGEHLVMS